MIPVSITSLTTVSTNIVYSKQTSTSPQVVTTTQILRQDLPVSATPSTTEILLETKDPMRNALLKIADTIKILEPLPPQVTLADTVSYLRLKRF